LAQKIPSKRAKVEIMTQNLEFDILIVGGGLAGASLACALRGSAYRIGLLELHPPVLAEGWDSRVYAISPANVDFLARCGAWGHIDRQRIQAVARMEVHGDAGGKMAFSAYESGLDALAFIVESSRVACELWETARRQSNIEVFCPAQPLGLAIHADSARLTLADGRVLSTALLVGADGAQSWVRDAAGLSAQKSPYGEQGVVANFVTEHPHRGIAYQWFRHDGVLAYLPLPENRISIVWSTPEVHAESLLALPPEQFAKTVAEAGEQVLGKLGLLAPAKGFPLGMLKSSSMIAPRVALVGDAAHGVHPLSGHGINLGFQDARVLSELLLSLPTCRNVGELALLGRYARARAEETFLVQGLTHGLHGLFQSGFAPLSRLRNFGLTVAGKVPGWRGIAARYAAGLW